MAAQRSAIRGVWATVLLDIGPDESIRLDAIDQQIAAFAAAGLDGVYCNGTATEVHLQTEAQTRLVSARTVAAARAHRLPVQVGAAHPLPHEALDRVAFAATLAPDAIQVTLPDWTPIDGAIALRFLGAAAETAAGVPLVLYNPPHAKTVLSPDALAEIAQACPGLIGLKSGGGDAGWYDTMASLLDRLSVFIPGHYYASGRSRGAHGSYSNMACLSPAGAVAWARLTETDLEAALNLEARIAAFMTDGVAPMLEAGWPGFACDKAMALAGGWSELSPQMLWPHAPIPAAAVARIAAAARRHLPDFMAREAHA